jgi:hypothetical protein
MTNGAEPWLALAAEFEAWDEQPASGRALLERLRALPELKGKEPTPLVGALRKVQGDAEGLLRQLLPKEGTEAGGKQPREVPAPVLRLLAVAGEVAWPWSGRGDDHVLRRYFEGTPEEVQLHAARVAALAVTVAPHGGSLDFLATCLRLKQREQWIPTACVLAEALAGPRAEALAGLDLEGHCQRRAKDGPFSSRHLATLGVLVAAMRGAKFGGHDATGWLQQKDRNEDDFSAIALACAELAVRRPDQSEALGPVAERALTIAADKHLKTLTYQYAEAARRVVEVFGERPVCWRLLMRPVPAAPIERIAERLFEAHQTLLWLRARGEAAREAELIAGPLACAPAIVAASRYAASSGAPSAEATEWLPRLTDALAQIAPARWEASPESARAIGLVVALVLVRAPLAHELDWPRVVAACGADWLEPSAGKTGLRGWVDLVGFAASKEALFRYLLHRGEVDGPRVLQTAPAAPARASLPPPPANQAPSFVPGSRETIGLARLIRARWKVSRQGGYALNPHLSNQCAQHIVRRLALATPAEAGRVILAVLAADAPPTGASALSQDTLDDELWATVRENLPVELDRGPLAEALDLLAKLESARDPQKLDAEADSYRRITALFPELGPVSAATDRAWQTLRAACQAAPTLHGESRLSEPETLRLWIKTALVPFAKALDAASTELERALGEELPDRKSRRDDVTLITESGNDELIELPHPILDRDVHARWTKAVLALRRLAEPLPTFVEAELDALLMRFDGWLKIAADNAEARTLLLERVKAAIDDEDEEQLARVLDEARKTPRAPLPDVEGGRSIQLIELLDPPNVRAIGNFWLRRLRFDENRKLGQRGILDAVAYYGPLVLAILGAPLTTVQTNYLWAPIIGDPGAGARAGAIIDPRFWLVGIPLVLVSVVGLAQDLRHRLAGLPWYEIPRRAAWPLAVLLAINYALAVLLWWVSAPRLALFETTLLWGSLSLYLGLFLGLLAQGARNERETVNVD